MKFEALVFIVVSSFLMAGCRHSAEKARYGEMLKSGKVRVEFKKGVELTSRQQVEVLAVAEQCGISDPGRIQTRKMLFDEKAIVLVESVSRGDERNPMIDRVMVFGSDAPIPRGEKVRSLRRVGHYWALAGEKTTYALRSYKFWGASIHVRVRPPVQPELADRIIRSLETRTFRAADPKRSVHSLLDNWSQTEVLPALLGKKDENDSFVVFFEKDGDLVGTVHCRFDGEEMVIERTEADYRLL